MGTKKPLIQNRPKLPLRASLGKCLHVFNECSAQHGKVSVNWDKIKALTESSFMCEPKGRERYRATDYAGCVFLSNHKSAIFPDNDDRRFMITDMDPNRITGTSKSSPRRARTRTSIAATLRC